MKRSISCIALFIVSMFILNMHVFANYKKVVATGDFLYVRSGAGTNYSSIGQVNTGGSLELLNENKFPDEGGCSEGWYQVRYDSKTGYICSLFVNVVEVVTEDVEPKDDYERVLKDKGFPSSYWDGLYKLHQIHPNWEFNAYITNVDWNTFINAESVVGKSLTDSRNEGYYSTAGGSYDWLTDTYKPLEAGTWYAASPSYIAYHADPRNWLYEERIFMFEDLTYHSDYQTVDVVESVLRVNPTLAKYAQNFVNVASNGVASISPVHLATRSRLELGTSASEQILGTSTRTYNGHSLYGYYNFFNVGSYADSVTSNPVTRGLAYACGPACGFGTTAGRPWDTPEKAIAGGANVIINNYFAEGQNTIYFEKWDVVGDQKFTRQYMTAITSPYTEGNLVYTAYNNANALGNPIVFTIPVYENMPASPAPEPKGGNQNNRLKDLKVNGNSINGFAHDIFNYTVAVSDIAVSVDIEASKIANEATVSGVGNIPLTGTETNLVVRVTAENGTTQDYNIKVIKTSGGSLSINDVVNAASIKSDGTYLSGFNVGMSISDLKNAINKVSPVATVTVTGNTDILGTNDKVSICNNGECKDYLVIIYGDTNGDGSISILDLLKVQKNILNTSKLSGAYLQAADTNKDGVVNILDLLKVQKQILGSSSIEQ